MRLNKLRNTLILQGIVAASVYLMTMLVIIIAGYQTIRGSVETRQEQALDALYLQGEHYLSETEHVLHSISFNIMEMAPQDRNDLLDQVWEHFPRFLALYLLDNTGEVISVNTDNLSLLTLDMSGQPYYQNLTDIEDVYFSDPFVSLTSNLVSINVAHPIYLGEDFQGFLVGEMDLSLFGEAIEEVSTGNDSVSYILDQRGTLIAHPNQDWVQERRNLGINPLGNHQQSEKTIGAIFNDPNLDKRVIGSSLLMENGWILTTIQPLSTAFKPTIYIAITIGLGLLLSMLVLALNLRQNSKKITLPLSILAKRADNLAKFPEQSLPMDKIDTFEEIDSLNSSFDKMAAEIHDRDRYLEEQVKLRSAEIVEKSHELENANIGLQKYAQDALLINEINEVLLSGESLAEVIERFAQKTKVMYSSTGAGGASVFLISKDGNYLEQQNNPVNPDAFEKIEKIIGQPLPSFQIPLHDNNIHMQVMESKKARLLSEDSEIEEWFGDFVNETWIKNPWLMKQTKKLSSQVRTMIGINSMVVIPLYAENEPIGLMEISNKEPFTNEDLRRLEMISAQLAVAIKRAQIGEEIISERNFSDNLINSLPGVFYLFNQQGKYLHWNKNMEDVTGYQSEEILQAHPSDFFDPEDHPAVREAISTAFSEGNATLESNLITTEGPVPYLFIGRKVIIDEQPHMMGTGIDISQRVLAENSLKLQTADLERSNQDLERFAFIASHDLQEPLRKIQSFGDRLHEKYGELLEDRGADYLLRMLESARRSQEMVEDLLVYSRVSIREKSFELVNLNQRIEEVLDDLGNSIDLTDALITVDDLPRITADSTQMFQLFHHLIDNALKFRDPNKKPEINIDLDSETKKMVRLSITDNGIGFDPQYMDKIFQPFQRLHGRDVFPGSGIGLAISRRIIERHRGSITAQSSHGEGATFTITLPK